MKVIRTEEYKNKEAFARYYYFDNTMQIDSIIDMARQTENETTKMLICHCNTFNENDYQLYRSYRTPEEIAQFKDLPSPYGDFSLDFGDRETGAYRFSLNTAINLHHVEYIIDYKKLQKP